MLSLTHIAVDRIEAQATVQLLRYSKTVSALAPSGGLRKSGYEVRTRGGDFNKSVNLKWY